MTMGGLFLFLFEYEVVVRADLPKGGLETVRATDETEEVWDGSSGAEEEWDRCTTGKQGMTQNPWKR